MTDTFVSKKEIMLYVLNDETQKTSHGFYLLNAGGNFERFRLNPVMLLQHDDDKVIGSWRNLRIEGSLLLADPVFDDKDNHAQEVRQKIEDGFLKGLSLSLYINEAEYRSNEATGDEDLFVTKWELLEASVVSIPSNAKSLISLKICDRNNVEIKDYENIIKLSIKKDERMIKKLKKENKTGLALPDDADDARVNEAIANVIAENERMKTEIGSIALERATSLVGNAIRDGKIDATQKDKYVKLATSDYELIKDTLAGIAPRQRLSGKIVGGDGDERKDWTYCDWKREDSEGLAQLKADDPEKYLKICKKNK